MGIRSLDPIPSDVPGTTKVEACRLDFIMELVDAHFDLQTLARDVTDNQFFSFTRRMRVSNLAGEFTIGTYRQEQCGA